MGEHSAGACYRATKGKAEHMSSIRYCPAWSQRQAFATAWVLLLCLAPQISPAHEAQPVRAEAEEGRLVVYVADEVFTAYKYGETMKYPFFYPVVGPATSESVTTYDQEPWPHHSSLFMSLDLVRSEGIERGNYWQPRHELETGQILATAPEIVEENGERVVLRDVAVWAVPGRDPQLKDTRTVVIRAPSSHVRVMDFQFDFEILQDLAVGPTGHSMFSGRMRPELAVDGGGTLVDAHGNLQEEGTRGQSAPWCAYYGRHHGEVEGMAIIQHPENPYYPAPWFNRDYGFFSPTPVWQIDAPVQWEQGLTFTKRYRVVVFAGDAEEAGIAGWHEDFVAQ